MVIIFSLTFTGIFFFSPIFVQAGIGSFLSNVFSDSATGTGGLVRGDNANAQTMRLLRAPVNSAAAPDASGGGDIFIVNNSALRSSGISSAFDEEEMSDKEGRIRIYVVREGDSLSQIASMFNVSINTILWSNDLGADDTIVPGQKLVILPITGIRYTIEEGDTLFSIVEQYGGKLEEVMDYNGIAQADSITPGDKIIIPNGELGRKSESKPSESPSKPPSPPTRQTPAQEGYYASPAAGSVITQLLHGYNAIDFGAPHGTPLTAAAPGTVIISHNSGWNGGYGRYIVIDHPNNTQTLYAHNSKNIVSVGDSVDRGQVIGYMGSSGRSTGPHVHFEVRGATNPYSRCALRTQCQ